MQRLPINDTLVLGSFEFWPLEGQNVYGSKMIFIELKTNVEFEMRRRLVGVTYIF